MKRRLAWASGFAAVLSVMLGVAWLSLTDRNISAPSWVRDAVELRLAEAVPGYAVFFGDVQLRVAQDGRAEVVLLDVDLQTDVGTPVATLSDIKIGLTAFDLLRRDVVLRSLDISGAFVTLSRSRSGALGLALGDAFALDGNAPDIPTLVETVDRLVQDPRLARLQSVTATALTLRFEDARARRGWTVDGGRLGLTRERDMLRLTGALALLGGGATAATLDLNATSLIGETAVAFGLSLKDMPSQDIATQSPALAWLGALRAPISGAMRGAFKSDGGLGDLNATLQIEAGVLQPDRDTPPVPFHSARSYFTFNPDAGRIDFSELSFDSLLGLVAAEGTAVLEGFEEGLPSAMTAQLRLNTVRTAPDTLFEREFSVARAEMDLRLDLDPFELVLGRLWVDDPQVPLRLKGRVTTTQDAWNYALDGSIGQVSPADLMRVWPTSLAPRTRDWVERNIEGGFVTHGQFALRGETGKRPDIFLNADFQEAQVRYAGELPVVEDAHGTLNLNAGRFAVRMASGRVVPSQGGAILLRDSTFVIPNTRQRPSDAALRLRGNGQIEALLAFLDSPPLRIMQKANRPVDLLSGRVAFSGTLDLPLRNGLRLPDMRLRVTGQATEVASDRIVPGRSLTAQQLKVDVTNDALRVSGRAQLSGVPFEGSWRLPIPSPGQPGAASRVDGIVQLSEQAAQAFGVALPEGTITGDAPANLTVTLPPGTPPTFALTSRLQGLGLSVPPVGWSLDKNTPGNLRIAGTLSTPVQVDRVELSGPGLQTEGAILLNADGSLDRVELERLEVGRWLNAPVTLTGRGTGLAPSVRINGGRVDLRSAPFGGDGANESAAASPAPLTVVLDSLQLSNSIRLADFRADLRAGDGLTGNFTAQVNGAAPIAGEAIAQNGGTALRIRSEDAGRVIAEAGILKTVAGGDLTLALAPVAGQPGSYDGALDVRNARLRDAPGIASLLDAISIVGLLDQLEGPGILFTEVEARFRLTPDKVILTRSSATGPSMGISLDGLFDLSQGVLDMQGVVSPIFFLNGIGSIFTRKGEGLIGFNFNLTGPASAPNVRVNPLSALTPGMFREIFRRAPPTPGE